jgi:hypothetical protein
MIGSTQKDQLVAPDTDPPPYPLVRISMSEASREVLKKLTSLVLKDAKWSS